MRLLSGDQCLQVWASKWNDRAWLSRRARGVPEDKLFMACLLQQVRRDWDQAAPDSMQHCVEFRVPAQIPVIGRTRSCATVLTTLNTTRTAPACPSAMCPSLQYPCTRRHACGSVTTLT